MDKVTYDTDTTTEVKTGDWFSNGNWNGGGSTTPKTASSGTVLSAAGSFATKAKSSLDGISKATTSRVTSATSQLETLKTGIVSGSLFKSKSNTDKTVQNYNKAVTDNISKSLGVGQVTSVGGMNINTGSTSTTEMVNNNIKLATPTFTSGTTATTVKTDIYGEVLNSPQNKITTVLGNITDSLFSSAKTGLGKLLGDQVKNLGVIGKALDIKTAENIFNKCKKAIVDGEGLTKEGFGKMVCDEIGYDGKSLRFDGGVKGLLKSTYSDIAENFDKATGLVSLANGTRAILHGNYDTAEGVFKIFESITGNSQLTSFFDVSSQMKVFSALTKTLANVGAVSYFDKIIEKIDKKDINKYINENLKSMVGAGDIDFLESALKVRSSEWLLNSYPNLIESLVSSYDPNKNEYGDVTKEEFERFVDMLYRLNPTWYTVGKRGDNIVYHYGLLSKFNDRAREAFLICRRKDIIPHLIISESFGGTYDCLTVVQARYPNVAIRYK